MTRYGSNQSSLRERSSDGPGPSGARDASPGKQTLVTASAAPPQAAAAAPTAAEPPARSGAGGGVALPDDVRGKMEAALGADFSQVRIHEGAHVASLGAQAYTQGTDIHFAPGQYQPTTQAGQELLGHELTHVVQQAQGRVATTRQAKGVAINDDAGLEREADELGARAARGQGSRGAGSRPVATSSSRLVQCFGFASGIDLQGPMQATLRAAELASQIDAWLAPMQTAAELRQARLAVAAAPAGAELRLGAHPVMIDEPRRAVLLDAVRRHGMARVVAVRAPLQLRLAAIHDAAGRRAIQDQMRTAARPFLDELRDPAQPGARFQHDDPVVQREVLAALTLDGEGHAEDELADQAAHGDEGPRNRARRVGGLPTGAWCGAFAYTQQHAAGLSAAARVALQYTGRHDGIDKFLDYERDTHVIWTGTSWQRVQDYHASRNSLRRLTRTPVTPTPMTTGSEFAPQGLDIQPGDIVLIDNYRGTYADHITQCRSYDPTTGQLETIAGNEGSSPGRVAASATPRPLDANPAQQTVEGYGKPSRVYAYGRFSIVDYEVHTYLPRMPADATESPEAMTARRHAGTRHGGH